MSSKCRGEISPVMSPALGNRIGIATWTYNARSALLPERVPRGWAQGSIADYTSMWMPCAAFLRSTAPL